MQVHDRATQVGAEHVRVPDVGEATGKPNERILHEILGGLAVPGQEKGERKGLWRVAQIELLEAVARGLGPAELDPLFRHPISKDASSPREVARGPEIHPYHRRVRAFEVTGPLETERLVLRPYVTGDFDALFAIQSRPDVARYLYWDPRNEGEVRVSLEQKIASIRIRSEGDVLALAIVPKESGALVGDVILRLVSEEHRQGEIGFLVHPDHHGRGYATEASHAVLRIAFDEIGLHRVIGHLEARNVASARVLEKLGMRREAHFVENEWVKDEWQSGVIYVMLDREWRDSAPRED